MDVFTEFARLMIDRNVEPRLDLACALISNAGDQQYSVESVLSKLDDLSREIVASDIESMMSQLFSSDLFLGNATYYDDPSNSYLGNVLHEKLGIPISLSVIALSVAQRKGFSLFGVGMPGHYLCGSINPEGDAMYFDPFHGSGPLSSDECQLLYEGLTGLGNWSSEFLRPVSNRLTIIRILANLKSIFRRRGDVDGIRWVMRMRLSIPEIASVESAEFARLVRGSN